MRKHLIRHKDLQLTEHQAKLISVSLRPDTALHQDAPTTDAEVAQKKTIQCRQCNEEFRTSKKLLQHLADVHYQRVLNVAERKEIRREYGLQKLHHCQYCVNVYEDFRVLRSHIAQEHPDKPLTFGYTSTRDQHKCLNCGEEFDLRSQLESHIIKEHLSLEVSSTTETSMDSLPQYCCWYCENCFETPEEVVSHMTNVHETLDTLSQHIENQNSNNTSDDNIRSAIISNITINNNNNDSYISDINVSSTDGSVCDDNVVSSTGVWDCPHCPVKVTSEDEYNAHVEQHTLELSYSENVPGDRPSVDQNPHSGAQSIDLDISSRGTDETHFNSDDVASNSIELPDTERDCFEAKNVNNDSMELLDSMDQTYFITPPVSEKKKPKMSFINEDKASEDVPIAHSLSSVDSHQPELINSSTTEINFSTTYAHNVSDTCPASTSTSFNQGDSNTDTSILATPENQKELKEKPEFSGLPSALQELLDSCEKDAPLSVDLSSVSSSSLSIQQPEDPPVRGDVSKISLVTPKTFGQYTIDHVGEQFKHGKKNSPSGKITTGSMRERTSTTTSGKKVPFVCWFCEDVFTSPEEVVVHMTTKHENLDNLARCIEVAESKKSAISLGNNTNRPKFRKPCDTLLSSELCITCSICKEKVVGKEASELHMLMHKNTVRELLAVGSSYLNEQKIAAVCNDAEVASDAVISSVFASQGSSSSSPLPSMSIFTELKKNDSTMVSSTSTLSSIQQESEDFLMTTKKHIDDIQVSSSSVSLEPNFLSAGVHGADNAEILQGINPSGVAQVPVLHKTEDQAMATDKSTKVKTTTKQKKRKVESDSSDQLKLLNANMCVHCSRVFCTRRALDVHTFKMHGKEYVRKNHEHSKTPDKPFNCWFCSMHFTSPEQVVEHMTKRHESLDSLSQRVEEQQKNGDSSTIVVPPPPINKGKPTPTYAPSRYVNIVPKGTVVVPKPTQNHVVPIAPLKKGVSVASSLAPVGFKMSYALAYVPVFVPKNGENSGHISK